MTLPRRKFLTQTMVLSAAVAFPGMAFGRKKFKPVRFGIVTDIHYSSKPDEGSKNYSQSLEKMRACVDKMNEEEVDFLIELGDFKDQNNPLDEKETLSFIDKIEEEFARFNGPIYHVVGNHDVDCITKTQFLDGISNEGFFDALNYYSFSEKSFHFIVLDSTFKRDGSDYERGNFDWKEAYVSQGQLKWLRRDLAGHQKKPTVVFIHHPLVSPGLGKEHYRVRNAKEVIRILEESGNVIAVFTGHYHEGMAVQRKNIFHYTLRAMVEGTFPEGNSFAIVEIDEMMRIMVKGFHRAEEYPK